MKACRWTVFVFGVVLAAVVTTGCVDSATADEGVDGAGAADIGLTVDGGGVDDAAVANDGDRQDGPRLTVEPETSDDPDAGIAGPADAGSADDGSADAASADDGAANATSTEPAPLVVLQPAKPGDSGAGVEKIQERLNEVGFTVGTVDGDYGPRTEAAVSAFQSVTGAPATGVVDRATIEILTDYSYDGLVVEAGADGADVRKVQLLLANGPLDPGTVDGEYGTRTQQAVWALEKLAGIPVDGSWGPADDWAYQRLMAGDLVKPTTSHQKRWVEVDLSRQVMAVYDPGSDTPALISHVSTGSGVPWENEEHSGSSITPTGDFAIERRISGWRESSLDIGRLYNPLYFVGGIAFHGATSVPLYPASHGCVRVPMHIAEYLPGELPDGTPVHVGA